MYIHKNTRNSVIEGGTEVSIRIGVSFTQPPAFSERGSMGTRLGLHHVGYFITSKSPCYDVMIIIMDETKCLATTVMVLLPSNAAVVLVVRVTQFHAGTQHLTKMQVQQVLMNHLRHRDQPVSMQHACSNSLCIHVCKVSYDIVHSQNMNGSTVHMRNTK